MKRFLFPGMAWLFFVLAHTSAVIAETLPIDRVIAIVNDDVILESQLESRTDMVYRQLSQKGGNLPPPAAIKPQVLEQLILENLQVQLAERASVAISAEELQGALSSIARQNGLDLERLRKKVEGEGMTFDEFRKAIEKELLLQRIQQAAVNKRIDITEQDITDYLQSEEGRMRSADAYHLAHIVLNYPAGADDVARNRVREHAEQLVKQIQSGASFEQLATNHSEAPDRREGGDLGWRNLKDLPSAYARVAPTLEEGAVSAPITTDTAVLILKLVEKRSHGAQWVEQTHARHILVKPSVIRNEQEAVELLQQLRERITAGEDFAELAKTYSEDFGSALKGGDLGWTSPGQLVPQFQEIMDNTAISATSYPFQSPYGWHILQVLERRKENMTDELIRQAVRNQLTRRRFEAELPLWQQELRGEAYVVIKDPSLQLPQE